MARKPFTLAAAFQFERGQLTPESFCFKASPDKPATIDAAGKDGARRFSGVAYSGDVIKGHYYWGDVVFDLSSTKAAQKLPMLLGHDNDKIVGFSDKVTIADGITLEGALSSKTQFGQEVAALSDEGFPWQMSVRIEPSQVDEVGKGKTAMVNGRQLTGPLTIFRNSVIREVSFTPTGWDAQTSATAMSRGGTQSTDEGVEMTPEEIAALKASATKFEADAKAAIEAKVKADADLAAERAKVQAFEAKAAAELKAKRDAEVKALFEACGIKHTPELAKPYEAMDADTFSAISTQMKAAAKPAAARDPALFTSQARTGADGVADATAISEKARELMFEAKKQGRPLDVVAACAKAKQLLAGASA